jgi:hypothetical protein
VSASRTPLLTWALVACGFVGALVLWILLRAPSGVSDPAESGEHASTVASAREPLAPPAETESAGTTEARGEQVRVELPRSPDTVGPRKTHAKVELVCGISGTETKPEEVRIQVLADSDAQEIDETAAPAVFAARNSGGSWVADVTSLFIGVERLPVRLRVVAQDSRCKAFADVALGISAAELARPSLIMLSARVRFDCPWFVRGRIVAPCPPTQVRVFEGSWSGVGERSLKVARGWRIDGDGRFELPMESTGAKSLTFREDSLQTDERSFVIDGSSDVELGDIVLERGAELSGELLVAGEQLRHAKIAIVRADAPSSLDTPLAGWESAWAGLVSTKPVLRSALAELGLLTEGGGPTQPIAITTTDGQGRLRSGSLREGKYWLVVLSEQGHAAWLSPISCWVPTQDFVGEFEATRVTFEFRDANGALRLKQRSGNLTVRRSDGERVKLDAGIAFNGQLKALVQPGTLLELQACGQEVVLPVRHSVEPLVLSVSPCD